MLDEVNCF